MGAGRVVNMFAVRSVTWNSDGSVTLDFMLSADIKKNGLHMTRTLTIPSDTNYADEVDAVGQAVSDLLIDALEDLIGSEPDPAGFSDYDEDEDDE